MRRFWPFLLAVVGLAVFASQASALVCVGPTYCAGTCGISYDCSCLKQDCYNVYPAPGGITCVWTAGYDCPEGPKDIYNNTISCPACLYCTTTNDTFPCSDQGAYLSPCYTGRACAGSPTPTPDPADPTPTPIPTPPPGVGWCTVSASAGSILTGDPVTVTLQASSQQAGGNTAYLKVVRRDHGAISSLPAAANNEYTLTTCSSTTNICTSNNTITLPTGEYYFYCGYDTGSPSCTGNPFCDYETVTPAVTDAQVSCPGYSSCNVAGGQDNTYLQVVVPTVNVTANIYDDPQENCTGTTAPVGYSGGDITLTNGMSSQVKSLVTDQAVFVDVEGGGTNYQLNFQNKDITWTSSCPPISYSFSIDRAAIQRNFYITQKADPWWQMLGGDYSGTKLSINPVFPSRTAIRDFYLSNIHQKNQ